MTITKEELLQMGFEVRRNHLHAGRHWSDCNYAVVIAHKSLPIIDSIGIQGYDDIVVTFKQDYRKSDCLCYLGSGETEEEAWEESIELLEGYKEDWHKGAEEYINYARNVLGMC